MAQFTLSATRATLASSPLRRSHCAGSAPWLALVTDNRQEGLFVGLWVPSIFAAGGFWMAAVRRA